MTHLPERIQLRRTKGWKMPPGAVKVDRSTIWGNPFTRADARGAGYKASDADLDAFNVAAFAGWLGGNRNGIWWTGSEADARRDLILSRLPELRGKPLACWCKPGSPCHADVLLALANEVPG
jgi:hypothetical protein